MKKKVLFVTYKLQSYRIPIFEIIGSNNQIELVVAHSGRPSNFKTNSFKEIIVDYKSIGRFTFYDKTFSNILKGFDVVVCMFYIQNLSFLKLAFRKRRNFKLIFWGIGVRASYNSSFDSPTIMNKLRYILAKRSDAMIFYTDYAKEKYISNGIDSDKLFVMQNTVKVLDYLESRNERNKILFVGTLYKKKKIFELVEAHNYAKHNLGNIPELHIVGTGEEFESLKKWIRDTGSEQSVILHGPIYDEELLSQLFTSSLACISPGQAGLSVLKSFGYGVPFITQKNAITGGERLNIEHEHTGILYNHDDELKEIIMDISINPLKYIEMGINAKKYYDNKRTPEIMAHGFIETINYVTS